MPTRKHFYAESVTQHSPGLPDECRATLGTPVRAVMNPERVLQNSQVEYGAAAQPLQGRVGLYWSVPRQGLRIKTLSEVSAS